MAESPARKLLTNFRCSEITTEEDSKEVWASEGLLTHRKLSNFRMHYARVRRGPLAVEGITFPAF